MKTVYHLLSVKRVHGVAVKICSFKQRMGGREREGKFLFREKQDGLDTEKENLWKFRAKETVRFNVWLIGLSMLIQGGFYWYSCG